MRDSKTVTAPDIYCTFYWMWDKPECADIFEAAADLAAPGTGIDFSCVRQSIIRKTDNGEILMAPVLATSFGMLVNTDLFKKEGLKVPTTWSELESVCAKLKAVGYASPIMGFVSSYGGSFEYNFAYPLLCSTGADINDNAVKQFRYAAHHVLMGEMTVDEAIAAYGSLE